ncbi:MAG: hypothetical protein H6714_02070 [Myxococcales bacterium]|nr:hypothetical protein [Myxococcales bacterium]
MRWPALAYGTPRKLPKPRTLKGRVVVLDIAFAANVGGGGFERVTKPFIDGLGNRLVLWVDHHDHQAHINYADDQRFVLHTKAEHGACPEIITPELVRRAGKYDTICCHTDFDGLCAAAKWILGGAEPYPGSDKDAYAIDTRLGQPSPTGALLDRAIRAQPKNDQLRTTIIRYLVGGIIDQHLQAEITHAALALEVLEQRAQELALRYQVQSDVAAVDATNSTDAYDKTWLLLLGQDLAPISLVYDSHTVTIAAKFDSGIDLLALLGISGGMPTRVSVPRRRLEEVLEALHNRQT